MPPTASEPPPTKARLALVNAAPESPTTASPAISTAISGAKNNAPPASRRGDRKRRYRCCSYPFSIAGYRSDRIRVCLLNSLHIGVANIVLTLAENVAKVVGLDLEL